MHAGVMARRHHYGVGRDQLVVAERRRELKPTINAGANRYYFRINPLFETGDERYAWLNRVVAVGKGRTEDGGVRYEIFEVT